MAMKPQCATAVRAAAGDRPISAAKLQAIEDAISGTMRELARQDRTRWQSLSRDQRVAEASAKAMEDIQAEAALKEYRATLQVLRTAESDARIGKQMALAGLTRSQGLIRDIENTSDYIAVVRDEAISGLTAMIDAAQAKDGTGAMWNLGMRLLDLDNPQMTADVVREVFAGADGSTGNKLARAGAQAWLDTIEGMRQRFNAAGGSIGKLGYGYLSQAHDMARVAKAGADAWAAKVLPLLDREQYVRPDGTLMDANEITDLLRGAWATLSTGGDNKTEPGQFKGTGARAKHGSEHRVLHFADGDAWMAYMKDYGEGSLYDSMMGHVGRMARDIGLVERYGPNPEQQFRVQADIARRVDGAGTLANRSAGNAPDAYWSLVSGKTGMPENAVISSIGQNMRNLQTAAKLGGAVLSSTTDVATIAATLRYNRLPYFSMLENFGRRARWGSGERDFLQAHGVIAESLTSSLNRWTGDHMTHSLTGRVAGSVMKLSFMNAWTDSLRGAFAATMMQGFAKKVGKGWADLDQWDHYLMQRKGITEADWSIISRATPTERNGLQYLTRDAIESLNEPGAREAATKWMAFVSDESQFAVVNPDMATRAIVTGGGMPAGTYAGEAMRSFTQFKSFPLAMMTRHWRRVFETPQGLEGAPRFYGASTARRAAINKAAVLAGLNVSLMMLGAVVLQNKALVNGKDPYDMTEGKFWMRALAQGGGAGYVGDLLFKDPTEQRSNTVEQSTGAILGPSVGAALGLGGDLIVGNIWEAAKGKDTHLGAESLRWLNSQTPYVSLWQTRALWEHWFLHNAQEALNPGYLSRMQQRAQKDWGQGYWWGPGDLAPDRAPDLGRVVGE
jgi:DNA-binding transcriptional regulator YdaS (Cro superfamily)